MENHKAAFGSTPHFPVFTPVCWRGMCWDARVRARVYTPLTQNREKCEMKTNTAYCGNRRLQTHDLISQGGVKRV